MIITGVSVAKTAADRSFQRHQDVSVYIFKDAGDPNDRSSLRSEAVSS